MDRIEQTGRHLKGLAWDDQGFFLSKYQAESARAEEEFPEAAKIMQRFLDAVDFNKIRDMYREINAASQGRRRKTDMASPTKATPHERMQSTTNELTRNDFLFAVLKDQDGNINRHTAMQYADIPNVVIVNLVCSYFSVLERLSKKETLTTDEIAEKEYTVTKMFQLIFHELGHGYQYVHHNAYQKDKTTYQKIQHSAHEIVQTIRPVAKSNAMAVWESRTGTMFIEGWNDLLSSILMVEYLQTHSLRFDDVTITNQTQGIQNLVGAQFFDSDYGPASYALWAIAHHIAEHSEVDIATVIKGFVRVAQTKRGIDDLHSVLTEVLGESLTKRFFQVDAHTMEGKVLAHEIMEKVKSPEHWVENILNIITYPESRHK